MHRSDALILGRTIREHVGGRWVISWPLIAFGSALIFIFGLNNMTEVSTTSEVLGWFVVSFVGVAVVLLLLILARVTLFRNCADSPVPMWWVVVLGMVVGSCRSAVTVALSDTWGLVGANTYYVVIRLTTGALLGGALLPLTIVLASVISAYVTQRRELELELRDLEVERMRQSGRSEALREALLLQVATELTETAVKVDADEARQMSRRLWESVPSPIAPTVSWRKVLRVAVTHNPYPITLTVVLWVISVFGSSVLAMGFTRATILTIVTSSAIVGCFAVGRWLTSTNTRLAVPILVGVIVVLIVWNAAVAPTLVGVSSQDWTPATVVATVLWVPVLVITTGMIVSAVRSGDDVVQRMQGVIEDQQVAMAAEVAETARIQQELATVLHGAVQSRLLAAAAIIRQPGIADETVNDPGAALSGALTLMSQHAERSRDFSDEVSETVRSWIPLMDVTVDGVETTMKPTTQEAALRVIEEGLSNAFRHGGASEVRIEITRDEQEVTLRIVDNGAGPSPTRTVGLGSAVLDSLAPGAWSLTRSYEHTTVLKVLLRDSKT